MRIHLRVVPPSVTAQGKRAVRTNRGIRFYQPAEMERCPPAWVSKPFGVIAKSL